MASSSTAAKDSKTVLKLKDPQMATPLPPYATFAGPKVMKNAQCIPEPLEKEKRAIYESQVLIPVLVSKKPHALSGPLSLLNADYDKLKDYFPTYHKTKPIGSSESSSGS